ncbi:MAG: hypothetical protein EBS09_11690 [Flavobacteriia bacterium]|nr:hypothetical protein [Flavobacteriia bacterium]
MSTFTYRIIVIGLLSVFFSCTKKQTRIPIEGKIGVALHGNGTLIYAQTLDLYGSTGYQISSIIRKKNKQLHIQFNHVQAPDAGFTVLAPADANIALPALPEGTHRIVFIVNNQRINATLFLGATDSLHLEPEGEVINL